MVNNLTIKEKIAINFLQDLEYDNLYLAFSGGKDSVVIYKLAKIAGIKFNGFYNNTTIDPIGTIPFIRKNFPDIKINKPNESFYKLIERKGLPTRLSRYCCELLKEYGSIGKNVIEGIRAEESNKRANMMKIHIDTRIKQKKAIHIYPILYWTEKEVWEFIGKYKLPIAPAYKNGFKRLGCIGCPLITTKKRIFEFKQEPKKYYAIKKAINTGMKNNPQWKLSKLTKGNSDLAMEWWLSGKTMAEFNFGENLFNQKFKIF